jgi:hypothetical protein
MSIAREMDEALFGLCLLISRATDPEMQAALVRTQQRFEEVRLAVQALEELACRAPSRPAPVPSSWRPQRSPSEAEKGAGRVVSLEAVRVSRIIREGQRL